MNKKPSKEKKGMTTEEAIKKYLGNAEISKSSLDLVKELKELSKPIRGFEKITNIEFIEKKSELIVNQMRINRAICIEVNLSSSNFVKSNRTGLANFICRMTFLSIRLKTFDHL